MDHERLRNDLRKLYQELRSIKSANAGEEKLLRQLEADIEGLLSRDDDQLRPDADSFERLSEALAHVEASHPPGDSADATDGRLAFLPRRLTLDPIIQNRLGVVPGSASTRLIKSSLSMAG